VKFANNCRRSDYIERAAPANTLSNRDPNSPRPLGGDALSDSITLASLETLRQMLLSLKAAGSDGFEGLVASALSAQTGLVIRLAKSGSQFGRDASSGPSPFAVAMEAKRYDENLRLETLAGKVVVGGHVLSGKVDLWILGATSEVGEDTVRQLTEILEKHGVSLLVLDWSPRPLSPLSVLLAAARDATLAWFATYLPQANPGVLGAVLEAVAIDPSFTRQAEELRRSLTGSEIGLDALRYKNAEWLRLRFGNRDVSQRAFGQFITVADLSLPAVLRKSAANSFAREMLIDDNQAAAIALVGDEGVGKTWLVAQWWAALAEPPILIFVSGRRADLLDPSKPLESLAKLLAEQDEDHDESGVAAWYRRLKRWREQSAEKQLRFVVVLDGLNEHPGKPWADILKAVTSEVHLLGGLVVITARQVFWQRDVAPRIRHSIAIRSVVLEGYTDEELAAMLARVGLTMADLPPRVREFIRNPRVCTVALNLLNRLSLQPNELTIERLLFEYWHWRMEERGDLISHNIQDFEKLLRSHARAWLDRPDRLFDRDEWAGHSGASRRHEERDYFKDLTEIEEGRFLQVAPNNSGAYGFRQETLPFALALLVVDELKSLPKMSGPCVIERLDGILDVVQGFDIITEILAAAVGLSCLDDGCPPAGRVALIHAWFGLQNVGEEAFSTLEGSIRARPESFFDTIESAEFNSRRGSRQNLLLDRLIESRDHANVRPILDARLPLWLGRWSSKILDNGQDHQRAKPDRRERMAKALESFSTSERALFENVCVEVPDLDDAGLDRTTAMFIAGRPQAYLASGIFAWSLARSIARNPRNAGDELAWVVRLNRIDFSETEDALRRFVESTRTIGTSEPFRQAAAGVLRLLGTRWAAEAAEKLIGVGRSERWRRVAHFCDVNPHDPNVASASNLDIARAVAVSITALQTWNHMSSTAEDADLEAVTPALARFDPMAMIMTLRRIVLTIDRRTQLPLRQLGWHLPELSPLFDDETARTVASAYDRVVRDPTILRAEDLRWIPGQLVEALNPHLDAEKQLELFLRMPDTVPEYFDLRNTMKAIPAESLEQHLELALLSPSTRNLRRVLFFASATPAGLTQRSREIIAEQMNNLDTEVAGCASDVVYRAQDNTLNALVLGTVQHRSHALLNDEFYRSRAIAAAVVQQRREDLLHLVEPQFLGYAAALLGCGASAELAKVIGRVLNRLLQPITISEPSGVEMIVHKFDQGLEIVREVIDASLRSEEIDLPSLMNDFTSLERSDSLGIQQRQMTDQLISFERSLSAENASELVLHWSDGLDQILEHNHQVVEQWLEQILKIKEPRLLRQVYNLGVGLAGVFAIRDSDKAAAVFRHIRDHRPLVRILIGQERISVYEHALFGTSEISALDQLREDIFVSALDDAALEAAVTAAESRGADAWLNRFADRLLRSAHPGEQARGLTIIGLRYENQVSDRYLDDSWGPGFLGIVAGAASENYRRARWAHHWIKRTCNATEPINFWRFGTLAVGVADWRFNRDLRDFEGSPCWERFGAELHERLDKAARKRTQSRGGTLFGLKAPDPRLVKALRDDTIRLT